MDTIAAPSSLFHARQLATARSQIAYRLAESEPNIDLLMYRIPLWLAEGKKTVGEGAEKGVCFYGCRSGRVRDDKVRDEMR